MFSVILTRPVFVPQRLNRGLDSWALVSGALSGPSHIKSGWFEVWRADQKLSIGCPGVVKHVLFGLQGL